MSHEYTVNKQRDAQPTEYYYYFNDHDVLHEGGVVEQAPALLQDVGMKFSSGNQKPLDVVAVDLLD